jgi:hypothetical protein
MQKGLTLIEMAEKITAQRELKQDFIAETASLTMQVPPAEGEESRVPVLEVPDQGNFPILPIAHSQIGGHINIPAKYYDRMLKEEPDLLAMNVNTWFRRDLDRHGRPKKRMVRTLGGDNRAFLSNRYQRIENEQIAEAVLPVLMQENDMEIFSCEVTDSRMYIHATFPRLQAEVEGSARVGDVVQAGVLVKNSEVGRGQFIVQPWILELWCTNGCAHDIGKLSKRHLGRQQSEEGLLVNFGDDTKEAQDKALMLEARDTVKACLDEAIFMKTVENMSNLTQAKIEGDPTKAVEVLTNRIGTTEAEKGGILRSLIEGGDLSAWGLLNAVTVQAHTVESYDRAVEFETFGGQLLELPKTAWEEVLEAA